MFLAHLPAGYLATTLVSGERRTRAVLVASLLGSIAPDLDLLYFYLPVELGGGGRLVNHHHYWPHFPLVWITGVAVFGLLTMFSRRRKGWFLPPLMFVGAALLHCLLDTPAGGIAWLWPVDDHLFTAFTVPARYSPWILSFVLHWSFGLELAIIAIAVVVFRGRRAKRFDYRRVPPEPDFTSLSLSSADSSRSC